MPSSKQIRQAYIDFFKQKNHEFVPSASVVPLDDPTLLFTNAGMNQFKDIFLGSKTADNPRAVNSQKCIRVSGKHNDLEEVGKDTYHHTFFEMLGNWSFGDYFKEEAIQWAWTLFTDVWGFEKEKLWATVYEGNSSENVSPDTEAENAWLNLTEIPKARILRCSARDNFWEMGDTGPCGPCSEFHYDLGPERCDKPDIDHVCEVNGECGRYIELWNLVFIQYNRDTTGKLHDLPAKHVDTGAGLERIVAVLQNKQSNYDTDLFMPIIEHIIKLSKKTYASKLGCEVDNAFRVISDHIRTLTFAIADGATLSNEGRGYVLRRILRRAVRFGLILNLKGPFIYKIVPTIVDIMGEAYPELAGRAKHVQTVLKAEEESFGKTLERGIQLFETSITQQKEASQNIITGTQAFTLYDTYGFPLDLTELMAEEIGFTVDTDTFDTLMREQKTRARNAQKGAVYIADALAEVLPQTDDNDKFNTTSSQAKVVGYILDNNYITDGTLSEGIAAGLIMETTCAYGEMGGQKGDSGVISCGNALFAFDNTINVGNSIVHFGKSNGDIAVGAEGIVLVNDHRRNDIMKNHTATHILQWALQSVLGDTAHQEGSLVTEDQLRFDFTFAKAMTADQIAQVESIVREQINAGADVTTKIMNIKDAKALGAMALFSEKYGDEVRVVAIGGEGDDISEAFSRELCGGTHVANSADIGTFKILKEESVATGIRRIVAATGRALNENLYAQSAQIHHLTQLLKTTPDLLEALIKSLVDENKKLKASAKKSAAGDLKSISQTLLDNAITIGDAKIIIGELPEASVDLVRGQLDWLRQKAVSCVTVLGVKGEANKVMLFAAVTDDLIKQGVKAGDIVKQIAPIVSGGGGGKPQMAQAGGKDASKLPEALALAKDIIITKFA